MVSCCGSRLEAGLSVFKEVSWERISVLFTKGFSDFLISVKFTNNIFHSLLVVKLVEGNFGDNLQISSLSA